MKDNKMIWVLAGIIIVGLILFKGKGVLFSTVSLSEPVNVNVQINSLSMTSGCSGNILFAPTATYPLQVCVGPVCQSYTSGEYGPSSTFTIPGVADTNANVKFDWTRIKDPQSRYDHGESMTKPLKCYNAGNVASCSAPIDGSMRDYSPYYTSTDCTGEVSYLRVCNKAYLGTGCTSPLLSENYNTLQNDGTCRIYEGVNIGGTPASLSGCSALASFRNQGGFCSNFIGSVYMLCTPGIPASCPSGLCSYAQGTSTSSAFTLDSSGTKSVALSGSVTAGLTVSWDASKVVTTPACGDGTCDSGETCSSCSQDCGTCPITETCSDGIKNQGESGVDCGGPCTACIIPPSCGDGSCNGAESCSTCSTDCGSCSVPVLGDVNGDGVISMSELMTYIQGWKQGTNTMSNLMKVINNWKTPPN